MTGFATTFTAGLRGAFRDAAGREGLTLLAGRCPAWDRFCAARAGLRFEDVRAFPARRNFAMTEG